MAKFVIKGGSPVRGEIKVTGSKNAASKLIIASLLSSQPSHFYNVPNIGDVEITLELAKILGSKVRRFGHELIIATPKIQKTRALTLNRRNRIPILALAPLLARVGRAEVPLLGGDKIGHRPVNLHIKALSVLGAQIKKTSGSYQAKVKKLKGGLIEFDYPSVGATENAILGAVTAQGRTVIKNAATEPEIEDLIKFLQKMGALIELRTNRTIVVEGVKELQGAKHEVIPDRNEAVSFACLALATNGDILVKNARQDHLITFLNVVRKVGGDYEISREGIRFFRKSPRLKRINLETSPHPGFMTDWQQPLAVVLTQARGVSKIHETIYEDRFGYTNDLNLMGADIKIFKECLGEAKCRFDGKGFAHSAVIKGPTLLHSARLRVRDLRSGIAHLIAALAAKGKTEIEGIEEIDRGYELIDQRLNLLGVDIMRIE